MKIMVGGFYHETNTFNPFKTTVKDFVFVEGEEMLNRVAATEVFKKAGAEVIPSIYAFGLPSGIVEERTYKYYADKILDVLKRETVDGIWLHLHGAMFVQHIGSGELQLLKDIRKIVGDEIPISITLDLHANNAINLGNYVNIMRSYRSVPHVDQQETEEITAHLLLECIKERITIRPSLIRVPMIIGGEMALGAIEPMKSIFNKLEETEKTEGILTASFMLGCAWSDTENTAASVVVVPKSDKYYALSQDKAKMLAKYTFSKRKEFNFEAIALDPPEAISMALSSEQRPVFISDSGDNSTGGGVGINTVLLELWLRQKDLKGKKICLATINDARAYTECQKYDIGDRVNIDVGIGHDENSKSITLSGILKAKGDLLGYLGCTSDKVGGVATISIGNIEVSIANKGDSFITLEHFKAAGLDINEYDIICVKQGYLFSELRSISKLAILALTPGATYQLLDKLNYKHIPRPIFPLDICI